MTAPDDVHAEIEEAYPDRPTIADLRFLSCVENSFATALEPLGYRVDRWIGIDVGGLRFQPTFTVMPLAPAEPDADYHKDFIGVIEIALSGDEAAMAWRQAQACGRSPGCEFVVMVIRDERWVEAATPSTGWQLVPQVGLVEVLGVQVRVADLYR